MSNLQPLRRLPRIVLAAVLAVVGLAQPYAAAPAAAVDCTAVYCATLEIVPSNGAGSGRVTSDTGGIDCTWTPAGRSGTCTYQFSWPHFVSGGIDVDLSLDPDAHSYVCQGQSCSGLDQALVRGQHLNPGDDVDAFMVFNLGNKTTVTIGGGGTGSGLVTTSPAGLDCRFVGTVKSGTCSHDFWYLGSSYSVSLIRTPDAGSYACSGQFCGTPGNPYLATLNVSPGGSVPSVSFWLAKPVTVDVTGSGTVVSDPAGITCGSTCSKWFKPSIPPDDFITLTATPLAGWVLKDWGGACDAATGAKCTFFNDYAGATISVVFARTSTPAPSITPRPTPRPTPTRPPATPGPSTPTPTAAPSAGANAPGPSAPAASSIEPAASPEASTDTGMPGSALTPAPTNSGMPERSVASEAAPSGVALPEASGIAPPARLEPMLLALLGLVMLLALTIGFGLGRRRSRRGSPGAAS